MSVLNSTQRVILLRTDVKDFAITNDSGLASLLEHAVRDLGAGDLPRLLATLDGDLEDLLDDRLTVNTRFDSTGEEVGHGGAHELDQAVDDRRRVDLHGARRASSELEDGVRSLDVEADNAPWRLHPSDI